MKVRVKLFAVAKELAGCDELSVELPDGATISNLRDAIVIVSPALGRIVPHVLWAVGAEYANDDTSLNKESDVALIPPVSGG
jgi:molybdopterin converting factor small subunit